MGVLSGWEEFRVLEEEILLVSEEFYELEGGILSTWGEFCARDEGILLIWVESYKLGEENRLA